MESDGSILYPMFKMAVGIICLVLSCEYLYTCCVYEAPLLSGYYTSGIRLLGS